MLPSVVTHYLFNKLFLDSLKDVSFLNNNTDIYYLGGQGPDPFFYALKKDKQVRKDHGTYLHKMVPDENFFNYFNYANKFTKEKKDVLYSYILGAGLHYIVDRVFHPYVYYFTLSKDSTKSFYYHTKFETNLDVLLRENFNEHLQIFNMFTACHKKVMLCSKMYFDVCNIKNRLTGENSFLESYNDMYRSQKFLYVKYPFKKFVFDKLFPGKVISSMSQPLKIPKNDTIDYLNLKKAKWRNPQTGVASEENVLDLLKKAKEEALVWKDIVLNSYENKNELEALIRFCNNLIYDGVNKGTKMIYYDNAFEKEGVK